MPTLKDFIGSREVSDFPDGNDKIRYNLAT